MVNLEGWETLLTVPFCECTSVAKEGFPTITELKYIYMSSTIRSLVWDLRTQES